MVLVGAVLVLALAHISIVVRLAVRQTPRWRALLALVVVPLAPWWAHRAHWQRQSYTWLLALVLYALALLTLLSGV